MMRRSALEEVVDGLGSSLARPRARSRAGVAVDRDLALLGVSVESFSSPGVEAPCPLRSWDVSRETR